MKLRFKAFIIVSLLIFIYTNTNAQATINLNNYTLASGPTTITQIPDDLSGLTYNALTNSLFASINGTPTIYELDLNGNVLRTINLTDFEDTEGLVWIGGTDFIIIEERRGRAVHITITAATTAIAYPAAFMQLPGTWGNNLGIEGVTYNPATNELIIIKEKSPLTIYAFIVPASFANPITVTNPFNISTNNFGFSDISGLHHLGLNTFMPCGEDVSDNYLILSHESAALIETDDTGTEYSRLNLTAGGANGTIAATLPQAEGVTMDNQGNIYVVSEPNLFYKFEPQNVCCATVDLTINFDAAPQQTSWEILDGSGNIVASGGTYPGQTSVTESVCLPDGCYDLVMSDSGNDGMCPRRTTTVLTGINIATLGLGGVFNGSPRVASMCGDYTLTDPNGTTLASGGGRFGTSESNGFCLTGGISPIIFQQENTHSKTSNEPQMRIIPNIVNDQATLYYSFETKNDIQIKVVDITGKIVQEYTRNFYDVNEINLNVNDLQSGFYFVQMISGDVMLTEKFVKK